MDIEKVKKLLMAAVITAFAVSLWGAGGHFGRDPTCFVLTGNLTANCWQKEFDPTVRIFSTLGQPNWLASYLVLILPFALAMSLRSRKLQAKMFFVLVTLTLFWALILTSSRSGAVGGTVALIVLILLLGAKIVKINIKILALIALASAIIALTFAPTLVSRVSEALKQKPSPVPQVAGQTPVIIAEPTESGQIRLIVWQGALEVFKKYPLLGSGPETFAYSYYLFRPLAHNQTTEWNFFYNKAHNEFLNYLANIGILGATAYITFILTTLITLLNLSMGKNQLSVLGSQLSDGSQPVSQLIGRKTDKLFFVRKRDQTDKPKSENRKLRTDDPLLTKAAIAAILGYHTTIFFGFSTVATQVLMFVIIASTLILQRAQNLKTIKLNFPSPTHQKVTAGAVLIAGAWTLTFIGRIYLADFYLSRAKNQEGLNQLVTYANVNQISPAANPFYLAEYTYALALSAATIDDQQTAKTLVQQTTETARIAQEISPNNLITARKIANAYFLIADFDPQYRLQSLALGQKLTQLAPTDPQSYLSLAQIQAGLDQKDEALKTLHRALELKPNYDEARELLEQLKEKELQ